MAYDAKDEPIDVGVFASRWSEDRPDYPRWSDDPARPVRVLDTMGAAFANLADRAALMGLAIIDIIVGIVILSLPKLSLATLAILIAISLITRGVFAIYVAVRLRGAERHDAPRAPAPA